MRRQLPLPASTDGAQDEWGAIRRLTPYLLQWRGRIALALACLLCAKLANIAGPLVFKEIIDGFAPVAGEAALLIAPLGLIAAYGFLRLGVTLFTELRELLFNRVTQRAVHGIALQVLQHLHHLSLRFHLERQTGGLSRDIERGTRAIGSLISYAIYSILPTLIEVSLVLGILAYKYEIAFTLIAAGALIVYVVFTILVSNWRVHLRRVVNETDSAANTCAIDSLINYETVKYFNNEDWELQRYDAHMRNWQSAQVRSLTSLSMLNLGQAAIIAVAVTLMMWRAAVGVANGSMTVGDIVLVNAFLIQLYIPLNFLGVLYREIRQSLADIERLFALLQQPQEIVDPPQPQQAPTPPCAIAFDQVGFAYEPRRRILHDVTFTIAAGQRVAVVGHSGGGKSTLARLLFRFYDVSEGAIRINGCDIRHMRQQQLRAAIGIVPQDTVLFNESIRYNIAYGRPDASEGDIIAAARAAHLADFIAALPDGYATKVGERGLKLSGGEKQRVAIARALLKNPSILVFDEATSALDSQTEKAIQAELELAARGRTTLVIAHRLSTIMDADAILVMDAGCIVERGTHDQLLAQGGTYAAMWALQQQEGPAASGDDAAAAGG